MRTELAETAKSQMARINKLAQAIEKEMARQIADRVEIQQVPTRVVPPFRKSAHALLTPPLPAFFTSSPACPSS